MRLFTHRSAENGVTDQRRGPDGKLWTDVPERHLLASFLTKQEKFLAFRKDFSSRKCSMTVFRSLVGDVRIATTSPSLLYLSYIWQMFHADQQRERGAGLVVPSRSGQGNQGEVEFPRAVGCDLPNHWSAQNREEIIHLFTWIICYLLFISSSCLVEQRISDLSSFVSPSNAIVILER